MALLACLFGITDRQLWRDEHATWWAATIAPRALLRLLSNVDAVLAPYYVFMRGWIWLFGDSALALRLPSALAMSGCAASVGWLGLQLRMPRVGVVAGTLFALLPSVARYGQEARPYALVLLACALSSVALLRACEAPRVKARWAIYAASLVLLGALHLVALTVLLAHAVLLFEAGETSARPHIRRDALKGFAAATFVAFAVLTPLSLLGSGQSAQIGWTLTLKARLLNLPHMIIHAKRLGRVVLIGALLSLWKLERSRIFLGVWALGPTLLLYATHPVAHLFVHRYLLFTLPAWVLLCALTLDDLSRALGLARGPAYRAYVLPALFLLWTVKAGWTAQTSLRASVTGRRQYDYVGAAKLIKAHMSEGDALAFQGVGHSGDWARMALRYEFRAQPAPSDIFMEKAPDELGSLLAQECPHPARCLPGLTRRIWLVVVEGHEDLFWRMPDEKRAILQNAFETAEVSSFYNLRVARLERR